MVNTFLKFRSPTEVEGVLPIAVFPTEKPGQFVITRPDYSICPRGVEWDDYYVNFSGYFGSYNPSMFAAAPDLLEALRRVVASYIREAFLRTADVHRSDCACLRCAIDNAQDVLRKADAKP